MALREAQPTKARQAFGESLKVYETLYGPKDWRVIRAQEQLLRLPK